MKNKLKVVNFGDVRHPMLTMVRARTGAIAETKHYPEILPQAKLNMLKLKEFLKKRSIINPSMYL